MPQPKLSLKARALRYLSMREHSRLELARKLARYAGESDNVDELLDQLEAARFLSEERFATSLLNRRSARFGNSRILMELQSHDIAGEVLTEVRAELSKDEVARARQVRERKFGALPDTAVERARQMRFLQQRGFSHRAIQAALHRVDEDGDRD